MDEMSRYIELKPKYDLCEPSSKELIKTQNLQGMLQKTEMLRNFRVWKNPDTQRRIEQRDFATLDFFQYNKVIQVPMQDAGHAKLG